MIFGDLGSLGDLISRNSRVFPHREGFVYEGTHLSWREVNERVNRLGNAFNELGLRGGDRLAILGKNSHRYLEAFFAAAKTGGIAVKLNYRSNPKEIEYILNDCGARGIVFDAELSEIVRSLSPAVPSLIFFICTDQPVESALEYENLLESSQAQEPPRDIAADSLVMIQYTSGTTGKSKGVMLTHRGQILLANNGAINLGHHRALIALPLFTAAATGRMLAHVYLGNPVVISREFEPHRYLEMIGKERITWTGFVPSMFYLLKEKVQNINDYDLGHLKRIIYGAAPMTVSQLKTAMEIFKGCEFEGGYGLTETGPYGPRLLPQEHRLKGSEKEVNRLGSVGRMGINGMLRIVGKTGEDCSPGEIGEIAIYCDSNMIGYWNKPEETAETLRHGWVFTGDLGEMDEDGYVFIRDRKKDMIISGGFNILSKEIEDVLQTHPSVLEAAVIGIPDPKWGESVLAFVMRKEGQTVNEQELMDYCRENLASYKKPKKVEFVQDFPRTATQKIQKYTLRERYWAETGRKI